MNKKDISKITLDGWEGDLYYIADNASITIVDKDGKITEETRQVLEIEDIKNLINLLLELQISEVKEQTKKGVIWKWFENLIYKGTN